MDEFARAAPRLRLSPHGIGVGPSPYRLVSLMDILETSAEAWWRLASLIGQMMVRFEHSIPPLDDVAGTLGELAGECERLDLPLSLAQLLRIEAALPGLATIELPVVAGRLRGMVADVNLRVWDELKSRFFLSLPAEAVALYRQDSPF